MKKSLAPSSPKTWRVAQAIAPEAELRVWLQHAETQKLTFRAPLQLTVGPLGITSAALGIENGVTVKIDDTRLGIGLAARARQACGNASHCAFWVEANWQNGIVVVNRVESSIADEQREQATHIYLAAVP